MASMCAQWRRVALLLCVGIALNKHSIVALISVLAHGHQAFPHLLDSRQCSVHMTRVNYGVVLLKDVFLLSDFGKLLDLSELEFPNLLVMANNSIHPSLFLVLPTPSPLNIKNH